MPRTDKEIAEYVRYYAKNNQRKWAVEMLTKTEGKTAEEIEHICNVEDGKVGAQAMLQKKTPKYSDEFLDAVAADRDAGMSYKDIADKYKMPVKTINSIFAIISHRKKKAAEPEMKQQEQAVKELPRDAFSREPEAYPGQIHDDPEPVVESVDETAEPVVESDVKIFLPGEEQEKPEEKKIPTERLTYRFEDVAVTIPESQRLHAPAKNLWFALRDELRAFALGIFGAGTELIEENVSAKYHDVTITVETPDGDRIMLSIAKEKGRAEE